jgi:ubiquinone/menaquinone biosynthesis C-methylase UbiE
MLGKLFVALCRVPYLKKKLWGGWYDYLARSHQATDWTFMNYGFQEDSQPPLALESKDEKDRYCIQLYNHVAGAIPLNGKRVLEVGSGRGGGASFVSRYLKPSQMTGVDLSPQAVSFCRHAHPVPSLTFEGGDAEHLPFETDTFDAVINVESSHCYPHLPSFFKEARRVLKPGGHFLYADLHEAQSADEWIRSLKSSGFELVQQRDITSNVLAALDRDDERKVELIKRLVPSFLQSSFLSFAGIRGTKIYEAFRSRSLVYYSFVAH